MKKIISIFLLGLVSAVTVHADEFTILYAINAGDIVFDTIAISKTTVNSYNPFDGKGKYVGFVGADGYSFINFDKTNPATVRSGTIEVTGYNGDTSSNYYFLELANGESVVGYTDFVSYTDLQQFSTQNSILVPFTPIIHSAAVPEPSSGLLLLIGGALVGLRRKRRVA